MSFAKKMEKIEKQETADDTNLLPNPGIWLPKQNLVFEQIEGEQYLLSNGKTVKELPIIISGGNFAYIPLPEKNINWQLCTQNPLKPTNKKKLWQFVKKFIWHHVELPDERLYDVLTAWVFATWISEKWDTSPYVFFCGPKASGKTRALETLQYLSYRGKISISTTPPALFRSIEKYNTVPFLDEAEVYNQEGKQEIIACLNAGYKRSSGNVERFQGDCESGDVVTFHVFGFKGIAGTEAIKATLESRSVVVHMAQNTRHLDVILNTEMALRIRNGLLRWRFETLLSTESIGKKPSVQIDDNDDYDEYDEYDECDEVTKPTLDLPPEFKDMKNSRVIELFMPLYAVADDEAKKIIVDYAKTVNIDQKTEENTSTESEILLAILSCHDLVEHGVISNKILENAYNLERSQKEQLFGKRLTDKIAALGFERKRESGKRGFIWNTKKLRSLCERYGFDANIYLQKEGAVPLKDASLSSLSSLSSQPTPPKLPSLDQVVSCTVLEAHLRRFNTVCPMCQQQHDTFYNVTYYNKTSVNICMSCGSRILEHLQHTQEMETAQ